MDDNLLWGNLKNGDTKALKIIYDTHVKDLINYSKKFTSDLSMVEDVIHDLFVNIWNKRETLGTTDSIVKYLCVALRRDLIRQLNKSEKTSSFSDIENKDIDFSISYEDLWIQEEGDIADKQALGEAFKDLSSRQREAIYLKFYEEMSYEQICEIMDINYQSVRNLVSKGIATLKDKVLIAMIFTLLYI